VSKTYNDEAHKNQAINQQQAESNRDRIDNSLKQVVARENVQHGRVDEKQPKDNIKRCGHADITYTWFDNPHDARKYKSELTQEI